MANTASKHKPITYAIRYGFVSGPAHGRRFCKLANAAGLTQAPLQQADIVIAHSAGCWLLPVELHPQLVVYVSMPLTEARLQKAWLRANLLSFRHGPIFQNLQTKIFNIYYILRQPLRNLDILRHPKIGRSVIFKDTPALFIANRYDPWPTTDTMPAFIAAHDWRYLSLPGAHDDIWEAPDKYVNIIKGYATEVLAQTNR